MMMKEYEQIQLLIAEIRHRFLKYMFVWFWKYLMLTNFSHTVVNVMKS
jgi:hypothetical protein